MGSSSPLCAQLLLMPWNWRLGSKYVIMIIVQVTMLWLNRGHHSPKSNISSLTAVPSSQRSCSVGLFGHLRECPILGSGQISESHKQRIKCPFKPSFYFNVIFFVPPRELVWYLPQTAGMQVSVRQSGFFLRGSHTADQLGTLPYPSIPPRVSGTSLWEVGAWAAQQSTRAWQSLPRGLWLSLFSAGSWSETNCDRVRKHMWNNLI